MIDISVSFAHLARIIENASCHGVSRKVIFLPSLNTWYAQIFCVIHPASHQATDVLRI